MADHIVVEHYAGRHPVCAVCKQTQYDTIELSLHALTTHSYCPDCFADPKSTSVEVFPSATELELHCKTAHSGKGSSVVVEDISRNEKTARFIVDKVEIAPGLRPNFYAEEVPAGYGNIELEWAAQYPEPKSTELPSKLQDGEEEDGANEEEEEKGIPNAKIRRDEKRKDKLKTKYEHDFPSLDNAEKPGKSDKAEGGVEQPSVTKAKRKKRGSKKQDLASFLLSS